MNLPVFPTTRPKHGHAHLNNLETCLFFYLPRNNFVIIETKYFNFETHIDVDPQNTPKHIFQYGQT